MFTHSIVRLSVTLAFAATVSGTAFARRPPALVQSQEQAAQVLATCPEGSGPSNYRATLARAASQALPAPAVAQVPVLRKMGDHVVLLCRGGRVHGPGGYRDIDWRFNAQSPEVEVAQTSATCM